MFKKILRLTLWAVVILLAAFIIYMAGAVMMLQKIDDECQNQSAFAITEERLYMCIPINVLHENKEGVDS